MNLVLKSKRLILRPPKFSDAPILEKYINDRLVSRHLINVPYPYPKGGFKKWIKKSIRETKSKESFDFIITLNKEPIGSVGLEKVSFKHKKAILGYWLARKYWGREIMTEAVKLVLDLGFKKLKLHRIESAHFKENKRSKRVQEKCGLKFEGIKKENIFKNGKYYSDVERAILVSEYKKLQRKWNSKKNFV